MRNILSEVVKVVKEAPNTIGITGHTESVRYANTKNYSNWELSADRANATRRAMIELGIPEVRFSFVRGKEGTEPFDPSKPAAVMNRRVGITLLNKK
jgi:chemotaxis protein MotB